MKALSLIFTAIAAAILAVNYGAVALALGVLMGLGAICYVVAVDIDSGPRRAHGRGIDD